MKMLFILLVLVISSNAIVNVKAGIFRKGKVFPLIKNRLIINERPATPATPNPPPIISLVPPLISNSPNSPVDSTPELDKEEVKELIEVIVSASSKDSDSDNNTSNPFLPIGGAAAGGLAMLLAYLRNAYSFIKG